MSCVPWVKFVGTDFEDRLLVVACTCGRNDAFAMAIECEATSRFSFSARRSRLASSAMATACAIDNGRLGPGDCGAPDWAPAWLPIANVRMAAATKPTTGRPYFSVFMITFSKPSGRAKSSEGRWLDGYTNGSVSRRVKP